MPSLETLLKARQPSSGEENIEKGKLYSFSEGNMYTKFCNYWCWQAPGNGTVELELWGAGGSGAKMCCCGFGLPGNSGAYAKKSFTVQTNCYMCGCIGFACGNSDALCFRGCSEPSMVCWFGNGTSGCMCSQGGKGGVSICSTTPSGYCCFRANGFCVTNTGPNCGIVCNRCSGDWRNQAYGGDINCEGNPSCVSFFGCYPSCICLFRQHLSGPAGVISQGGAQVQYGMDDYNAHANWSGQAKAHAIGAINGAGRTPQYGHHWRACWRNDTNCGCYNMNGCASTVPIAWGGPGPQPCGGVRDHATRGGMGAARIKFVD